MAVFIDINGHKWPCTGGVNAALPANVDSGDSLFKMGRMRKFAMYPFGSRSPQGEGGFGSSSPQGEGGFGGNGQ